MLHSISIIQSQANYFKTFQNIGLLCFTLATSLEISLGLYAEHKIKKDLKYNTKWCVLFLGFTITIGYWFGVTGSHGMEAIERNMIIPAY
jgi:4-hydroxybenzoate polyprenyltransferase